MKKHSCRMTDTEKEMHDRAVKIRKMTDEQLVQYVNDRVEKARSEGFNQGKKSSTGMTVNDFLKENTMELVDPLDIKTLIDENEAKRNALLSELDTRLKVSNATAFIEI